MTSSKMSSAMGMWRNKVALLLIVVSFIVLVPGLFKPILTIEAEANILGTKITVFKKTRSIAQTIHHLHEVHHNFVAGLILLFSVLIPIIKGIILIVCLILDDATQRYRLYAFVNAVAKWSMADVFAVGTLVAFLTSKASIQLDAQVGVGFYYFVAYCIISLMSLQLMQIDDPRYGYRQVVSHDDDDDNDDDDTGVVGGSVDVSRRATSLA